MNEFDSNYFDKKKQDLINKNIHVINESVSNNILELYPNMARVEVKDAHLTVEAKERKEITLIGEITYLVYYAPKGEDVYSVEIKESGSFIFELEDRKNFSHLIKNSDENKINITNARMAVIHDGLDGFEIYFPQFEELVNNEKCKNPRQLEHPVIDDVPVGGTFENNVLSTKVLCTVDNKFLREELEYHYVFELNPNKLALSLIDEKKIHTQYNYKLVGKYKSMEDSNVIFLDIQNFNEGVVNLRFYGEARNPYTGWMTPFDHQWKGEVNLQSSPYIFNSLTGVDSMKLEFSNNIEDNFFVFGEKKFVKTQ